MQFRGFWYLYNYAAVLKRTWLFIRGECAGALMNILETDERRAMISAVQGWTKLLAYLSLMNLVYAA
jgi:hypothetical protein